MSLSYTWYNSLMLSLSRSNSKKYEPINVDYHIIYYPLFFEFPYLCLLLKRFHIISLLSSSYSIWSSWKYVIEFIVWVKKICFVCISGKINLKSRTLFFFWWMLKSSRPGLWDHKRSLWIGFKSLYNLE